ncbi:MAG: peptidylprolyl isomerase [Bacteroidales bacterium]|nr:peptidylprolyl isomerase [Bacteroidales bacterium]
MKLILLFLSLFIVTQIFAQTNTDNILFRIDEDEITKDEFIRYYKKNNNFFSFNKDSLRFYLDKFIDIKIKVKEARDFGIDKSEQFKSEFNLYKKQLSKFYLADKMLLNKLAKEAYERLLVEIRVKHILISLNQYASKEDSVIAYNKAINIKNRIIKGEDFSQVAKETSDDPGAVINGGDLWYITAFDLPYDFENYVYKTNGKGLSGPLKTKAGYQIIKIEDRRTNMGSIKIAHIMLSFSKNKSENELKSKIDSIYNLINLGSDFSALATRFSDDKGTSLNGGVLPWFTTGQMPNEFELATISLLKNGDVSKPIKTNYGWHILKKIDSKEIPLFENMKDQIEYKVENSDRFDLNNEILLKKIEKENVLKEFYSLQEVKSAVDSSIFEAKWAIPIDTNFDKILFTINNIKFHQYDFVKFIFDEQIVINPTSIDNYVNKNYDVFKKLKLIELENKKLELKYPEYRYQLNEFSDRTLLRYFMEGEVFRKAIEDSVDLKNYYSLNKEKYNSKYCSNFSIFEYDNYTDIDKLKKYLNRYLQKTLNDNDLAEHISKRIKGKFDFLEKKEFLEGEDERSDLIFNYFTQNKLNEKTRYILLERMNFVILINSQIKRFVNPLYKVKRKVLEDYQKEIESKLLIKLKNKYKVEINDNVFETLLK